MTSKRSKQEEKEISSSEHENDFVASDSDAPEAVSMSTSKNVIMNQIKAEREAKRSEKEKKRKRTVALQEQNRQARLKKLEQVQAEVEEEISGEDEEASPVQAAASDDELAPLPDSVIQSALPKKIRFDSENESDAEELDPEEAKKKRAAEARKRLLKNLPFGISEVGVEGRARITREEIKARRAISRSKLEKAGSNVRRIDSVLDRARKTGGPAKVFSRSF